MTRLRRVLHVLSTPVLVLGLLAVGEGTATASHMTPPCLVVTTDTVLTGDVGPCDGHGIVVAADAITLDLNGHTVHANNVEMEQAGILLDGVSGVTVMDGTVTGFDAGVAIEFGAGNTITGMTVENNVNDMIETLDPRSIVVDPDTGPTPEQEQQIGRVSCSYGDGITTFDSNDNVITGNVVVGNGPYSGISLVGDSNRNTVTGNQVHDNDLTNKGVVDAEGNPVYVLDGRHVPAGTPGATEPTSMCGATEIGTPGMGRGREVQSIGVRVEGPGANRNIVEGNVITKSGLAGIAFHSFVQNPAAPGVPQESSNTHNFVSDNRVSLTGADTHMKDSFADGIASLSSGPVGIVTHPSDTNTVVRNHSFDNFRHGISLGRLTFGNTVDKNVVERNGASGIWVAGPTDPDPDDPDFDTRGAHDNVFTRNHGAGNGEYDAADLNPDCDDNQWKANNFRTFNQPCLAAGGSGYAPGRGLGGAGHSDEASGYGMGHGRP